MTASHGPAANDATKPTHTPYSGASPIEVKYAAVAVASSGDNTIVAAVSGKKIRVISYMLNAAAAVDAKWKSGASTDKTGLLYMAAAGYGAIGDYNPSGWFETAVGQALVLNLSAAVAVGGHISYVEV